MENEQSEKLSTMFDELIQDYGSLRNSLNEIYNESQNIRILSLNSSIEAARAGVEAKNLEVFGYAKTPGYNSYQGKEWSVVLKENY